MNEKKPYYGKPWTDGIIRRQVVRRLSRPVTNLLIKTPIRPNHISVFVLTLSLYASWLVSSGIYSTIALGGILYFAGQVLDACDGEIARLKNMQTALGHWLDNVIGDRIIPVSFIVASIVATQRQGTLPETALGWAIETAVALAIAFIIGQVMAYQYRKGAPADLRKDYHSYVNYIKENPRSSPALQFTFRWILVPTIRREFQSCLFLIFALTNKLEWLIGLFWFGANLAVVLCVILQVLLIKRLKGSDW